MTHVTPPACALRGCTRFYGCMGPPNDPTFGCEAYPLGIPDDIVLGVDPHLVSRGDDDGLTYQPPTQLKHQAGRHDQKTHTPKKYAGATRQVSGLGSVDEDWWDYQATDKGGDEMYRTLVMEVLGPGHGNWTDMENRGKVKHHVVQALADQTGLEYNRVDELVKTWAHTSNDHDPTSLGFQQAAADTFGVELSEWQKQRIQETVEQYRGDDHPLYREVEMFDNSRRDSAKLLKAMYDNTQVELKAAGLKEVTLYRGMTQPTGADPRLGDVYDIKPNAVGSWSLDYYVAENFASRYGDSEVDGVVLKMSVPAERIVSTPFTGSGCLTEKEFLVSGRPVNASGYDKAQVAHVNYAPEDDLPTFEPGGAWEDLLAEAGFKELPVVLIGSSILNSDWIKHVRNGQAQADDLAAHDYAGAQLKHMPGKHDQRFHTPHMFRSHIGVGRVRHAAREDVYNKSKAYQTAVNSVKPKMLEVFKERHPDLEPPDWDDESFDNEARMVVEVATYDEERFDYYAGKYGIPLELKGELMALDRQVDSAMMRAEMRYKDQATFKSPHTGNPSNNAGEAWATEWIEGAYDKAQRNPVGRDVGEVGKALMDRHNVLFSVDGDVTEDPATIHREVSQLLYMAEAEPAIKNVLDSQVKSIRYVTDLRTSKGDANFNAQTGELKIAKKTTGFMNNFPVLSTTWIHELGHAADPMNADTGAVDVRGRMTQFGRGKHVSLYAWTNDNEDWAETWVAAFTNDRGQYSDYAPEKVAYANEVIEAWRL